MLIDRNNSFLVIVDMQEKLVPAVQKPARVVETVRILASASSKLHVPIIVTEHCPDKIGHTDPALQAAAAPMGHTITKVHFNALAETDNRKTIASLNRRQAIVCGTETHVCVLQTAMGLLGAGYNVLIVADGVSSRKKRDRKIALQRLAGKGADLVTAEMVIFEWLHRADTDDFRITLPLIKSLKN